MRRPHKSTDRTKPDLRYNSVKVSKFINYIMLDGKKSVATRIVYDAFDIIEKRGAGKGIEIFEQALINAGPEMEVKSRRIGGANYQVPVPVDPKRQQSLAFRWIIEFSRKKKGKPMAERLADILIETANNEGEVVKRKENTHKMAEANKAFAHFAW